MKNATGATVEYGGSDEFEQIINIDCQAGSPPDIAVFPQPGLAANIAATGCLKPLGPDVKKLVSDNYAAAQSWIDLATYKSENNTNKFYGVFYRVNVKSLVWYSPDNFEDNGYEIPGTMEDLIALTEQMAADGNTPWCIGLGSGGATGWPATDWMEDIMLRTGEGVTSYDQWVTNELKFSSDTVTNAATLLSQIMHTENYVVGGTDAIVSTYFGNAQDPMFSKDANGNPGCFMHRQASFIPAFWPEAAQAGVGVETTVFPFPVIDESLPKAALGGGDMWGAFN